jgi:hypothetical protein
MVLEGAAVGDEFVRLNKDRLAEIADMHMRILYVDVNAMNVSA